MRRRQRRLCLAAVLLACSAAPPALAQDLSGQDDEAAEPYAAPTPLPSSSRVPNAEAARTAASAFGRAGERQSRDQVDGVQPMSRIDTRVSMRVQNRVRNRIDRNYDPTANATSPFEVAADRARRGGRPR